MVEKKGIDALNVRFMQVVEAMGNTGYSVSRELSTSEAVISNIRLGKNPPNIQLVREILNKYREIDAGWLLTGEGRMFRGAKQEDEYPKDPNGPSIERIDDKLNEIMALMRKSMAVQVERNVIVDESINALEQQVADLQRNTAASKKGRRNAG